MFASNAVDKKERIKRRIMFPTSFPIPMFHRDFQLSEGIAAVGSAMHVIKNGMVLRGFSFTSLHYDGLTIEWSNISGSGKLT